MGGVLCGDTVSVKNEKILSEFITVIYTISGFKVNDNININKLKL